MKNVIVRLIILVVSYVILLTGCTDVSEEESANMLSSKTENLPFYPPVVPPQPIRFDSFEEALDFIYNPSLDDYYSFAEAYRIMIDTFIKDGFITKSEFKVDNENVMPENVTLYPYANLEDIGVHYYFRYDDQLFQVVIYTADKNILTTAFSKSDETSFKAYNETRLKKTKGTYEQYEDIKVHFSTFGETKITSEWVIDESHYCVLRTEADKDKMLEFMGMLSFVKYDL